MKRTVSLRGRLFAYTLAVLLLGMGAAALLAWRAVEDLYLETQRENLLAQARLTAAALQGQPLPVQNQPYLQTSNAQPGIHTRLLSEQGAVVLSLPVGAGEQQVPPAENSAAIPAEELRTRPEIAAALRGEAGTALRVVAGRAVMYAAAPVAGEDGQPAGLVYLAAPLPPGGLPGGAFMSLAGAALGAILLALAAGSLLARRIAAPLENLARAANEVSGGDLQPDVPMASGIRELDGLGAAFQGMTASLRKAEVTQNAFVADVTHELRTPLTVIKGTIETLQDGALDDREGRGALLDSMQRESERLIRLVNDLLVLARANAGTLGMELQTLDLAELVRARCHQLGGLAARRGVGLAVTGAEGAMVRGDADRLAQVLDNLLDNALRFSPPGSTVTVTLEAGAGEWSCAVQDQGPGIPAAHLGFIFERFYRADAARSRQAGGAGLGLAIVRALVEAHGGRVQAESLPGQGATLRFWLPIPPASL